MRQQRRLWTTFALGLLMVTSSATAGWAEEHPVHCPVCARANSESTSYPSKASTMLVRGATNTFFGWTEILRQPARQVKAGGNVFTGMLAGLGQGTQRTLVGAGELLTFWTPKVRNRYLRLSHDCPLCMGKR